MRILVLNFEYPPLGGGASPVCHELNKRYVQAGHEVTVVTMLYKGLERFEKLDGIAIYRIPCLRHHVHISMPYEQLTYVINGWRFLKSHLKSNSFDVCHAHFLLPTGILCYRLKKKFGIPFIITAHGSDIPHFNPDRFKFLHLWTPPCIRAIARSASYITSPSGYLATLIKKVIRKDNQKIVVIPNGIDTSQYHVGVKENYIVSSGRLLPRKGFRDLLAAVNELKNPIPVHILGDGPLRQELQATALKNNLPVTLHGWVNNKSETYKKLLASASIYCLVSSRENASISILEAMASGCAIITANESGCPEMVDDAGILVQHGKPAEIKEAIETLLSNEPYLKSLSDKALERTHRVYDWATIVNQYMALMSKSLPARNS